MHKNWRWNYNTGGGQLLDWVEHHCDIAHWGMDCDNSGPLEIEGQGEFPAKDAGRLPENLRKVKLYESRDHFGNFLDCAKSRKPTITPIEVAHHSAIPGHL